MQAAVRCVTGAVLLSAVVGGLAYGTAQQVAERQLGEFRGLAQEECLANDPAKFMNLPDDATMQDALDTARRLRSLHDLCTFGMAGHRNS